MKKTMLAMSASMAIVSVFAAEITGMERLNSLGTALQEGRVTGVLAIMKDVPIPQIPSKWHGETHIKDEEKIKETNAAHELGHGQGLLHTHEIADKVPLDQQDQDNLMDPYAGVNKNRLRKNQWNLLNP
ncbi:MAG: hypothetical protein FWH21_01230 [Kiritimatiellaeota bacterium]|nr:hypothetical protein [Kiritimatiellota bacterium]